MRARDERRRVNFSRRVLGYTRRGWRFKAIHDSRINIARLKMRRREHVRGHPRLLEVESRRKGRRAGRR